MPESSRDEADDILFRPALEQEFRRPLDALGGQSCRDALADVLQSRWEQLAAESCRRAQRAMPTEHDALLAFDSVKHLLLGDARLLDLTLPEVWRLMRRVN
jgi:hypothetical protein